MKILISIVFMVVASLRLVGQEPQGLTLSDDSGTIHLNLSTGWTTTSKAGVSKTIADATTITSDCADLVVNPHTFDEKLALKNGMLIVCDEWGKLNRKNEIEQVPFTTLIARVLLITPPKSDFGRYRGAKLRSEKSTDVYDATIVPDSLGSQTSCTITDQMTDDEVKTHVYHCSLKTMSYKAAVEIEKSLVASLSRYHLQEDQIKEHGISQPDKEDNECAPTGECTHANMYISVEQDSKLLVIQARPEFIRNLAMDYEILRITGHHNFVESVSPDSATVELFVYSFDRTK